MFGPLTIPICISNPNTGYTIDWGLVLDGVADYIHRTTGAGDRDNIVFDAWVTKCANGAGQVLMSANEGGSADSTIQFNSDDTLEVSSYNGTAYRFRYVTTQVFRDPTAHFHLKVIIELGNATQADRVQIYVNRVRVTSFSTETLSALNANTAFFNSNVLRIGSSPTVTRLFNGILSQVVVQNGQTGASVDDTTESNINGNPQPVDPTGLTFGTEGFWLDFADSAFVGKDGASSTASYTVGDRTGDTTVTFSGVASPGWMGGTPSQTVNGTKGTSNGVYINTAAVAGIWIKFEFPGALVVTEATVYQDVASSHGTWKWQGSNNDSNWTDIGASFTHGGLTTNVYTSLLANTTAYKFYRMIGVSGTGDNSAWQTEWEFQTDGNNFTAVSIPTTAQVTDTPSNDANNNVANYPVWNAIYESGGVFTAATLSDGNLTADSAAGAKHAMATFALPSTGKWVAKLTYNSGTWFSFGIGNATNAMTVSSSHTGADTDMIKQDATDMQVWTGGAVQDTGITKLAATGYVECLVDRDADTVKFYNNGVQVGTTITAISSSEPCFALYVESANVTADFGQRGFTPTDSSYSYLSTANMPDPAIRDPSAHMQTVLYMGDATNNRAITLTGNSTFQPDLLLIKNRTDVANINVFDSVRGLGATGRLLTNSSGAAITSVGLVDSFDADGFTVDLDNEVNGASDDMVAWCFKLGGAGVSNTDGTITSTVSANTLAGMSAGTYTGTGANATVGQGLLSPPEFLMIFDQTTGSSHRVWCDSIANTERLLLDTTGAKATEATFMNSTSPTSSVFSLGTEPAVNTSGNEYVFYAFHSVEGFSKAGSYTGNGSADGPFVYCGFRPAFVMIKRTDAVGGSWCMYDNQRDPYNEMGNQLIANSANDEASNAGHPIDFTATGLKPRNTFAQTNALAGTYIFLAFAEMPVQAQSRAR